MPRPVAATSAWLVGALLLSGLFIARTMRPAFQGPGVIQDDARQHVFWMSRWADPSLFPNDLFADYFAAQAPLGYTALYWLLARVVDPLTASKLLPPFLGMAAALFTFLFARRLSPLPSAAFLTTILGTWYVWQYDDLPSGSPRAFLLPLLAAQLWLLAAGRRWPAGGIAALGALFYPTAGALMTAILGSRLMCLDRWPPRLSRDRADWLATAVAAALVVLAVLPTLLGGQFGPTVTAEAARAMPEFGPGGRNAFFFPDPYQYWIASYRGGLDLRVLDVLFPRVPILYELAALAALFPVALNAARRLPSVPRLRREAHLLVHVLLASFGLFFLAHLLLFRLYLPSRFIQWSLPLVLAVAAGIGLATMAALLTAPLKGMIGTAMRAMLPIAFALGLVLYPARHDGNFVVDRYPRVSTYLRAQPPETLVAGVPTEADSVPSFARRPVLTAREYALAYHTGYYTDVSQRTRDLVEAYYTDSPPRVQEIAARYGIDVFLVNRAAYDRAAFVDAWAGEFEPYTSEVGGQLRRSGRYALLEAARRCGLFSEGDVTIVTANCFESVR